MSKEINIRALERMAKIELSDSERDVMAKYLEYLTGSSFDRLAGSGLDEVKPLIHGIELENVFREDRAEKNFDRETLLKNAPEHADGYFKAPKTIV